MLCASLGLELESRGGAAAQASYRSAITTASHPCPSQHAVRSGCRAPAARPCALSARRWCGGGGGGGVDVLPTIRSLWLSLSLCLSISLSISLSLALSLPRARALFRIWRTKRSASISDAMRSAAALACSRAASLRERTTLVGALESISHCAVCLRLSKVGIESHLCAFPQRRLQV